MKRFELKASNAQLVLDGIGGTPRKGRSILAQLDRRCPGEGCRLYRPKRLHNGETVPCAEYYVRNGHFKAPGWQDFYKAKGGEKHGV
jgi:hypothetical protein